MELVNILIIVSAAVLILLLWIVVGVRHLRRLRKEIRGQWEILDEGLRKRHDLIPNLIETVRMYDKEQENLIERIIKERTEAEKEYYSGVNKIEYEYDLTSSINQLFELGEGKELGRDTNFLELRKEIRDIEKNVEEKTKKYNEMVRYYNKQRGFVLLKPIAFVFGFKVENIFEFEG